MNAAIAVTTRNRKQELKVLLKSALDQKAVAEIIVVDDGSTDGTSEMVAAEFPCVRLVQHSISAGLIVRRNELACLASSPVLVSVDDDAEFSRTDIVETVLTQFNDPRVGAVTIPYINARYESQVRQRAPGSGVWVTDSFTGCAHALRRDLFLKLGGYRTHLFHQGEEQDFCIRMLHKGFFVRLGKSNPILHFESPKRNFKTIDYCAGRNCVFFAWQNVPSPHFAVHLFGTTINFARRPIPVSRWLVRLRGVMAGWLTMHKLERQPVSVQTYAKFRRLRRSGPLELNAA